MHTVELLEAARAVATQLGYQIREEHLDGGGGACTVAGQKWLFLDVASDASEQLELVAAALLGEPNIHQLALVPELARYLGVRKSA
ncbi:MAG: hypothetical protein DWQ31_18820 [Planctomycetota bacterium]|nr:MAG: hypothetical protein DWQ31_18820 [Planctomycetota bacterium]REK12601.1 MAG: hypothetical protein DWQ37_11440 [Planctomycetota bacterium]REK31570.1 MAG: hypothetical protein DWQ42_00220 [Planctomycetota bacterium]REK40556.1 MAG: hypothetical protein DWQ46_16060 [Planctomycetota bacterium]